MTIASKTVLAACSILALLAPWPGAASEAQTQGASAAARRS